jgi:predicted TIM-barrel fold metal-dependent hydrolase
VKKLSGVLILAALIALSSLPWLFSISASASLSTQQNTPPSDDTLTHFAALDPIDTHAHVFANDPAFLAMLNRLHIYLVDICVFSDKEPSFHTLQAQIDSVLAVTRPSMGHVSFCTTFDPFKFRSANFAVDTVRQLDRDSKNGAVALKIWKNIGMELKTPDGKYVLPDDPAFAPIYRAIADHNMTLIAHVAEPNSCWEPPNPASPDYNYYKDHPEWYMYGKADSPSKDQILAARDHLLAENPKLRVVGAHLGSMEVDVDEIAKRFERYPNFAVDTAARVAYFTLQPRDKVRAFFLKYPDRVLYGTDLDFGRKGDEGTLKGWQSTYLRDWKFFSTNEMVDFNGRKVQGLQLPDSVLRKLYHDNAIHWIPRLTNPPQS